MAARMLKCKNRKCGKFFSSGFDFPGADIGENTHKCPHCEETNKYKGADYRELQPKPAY